MNIIKVSRRIFLKVLVFFLGITMISGKVEVVAEKSKKGTVNFKSNDNDRRILPLGADFDGISRVYMSKGHSPEDNLKRVINRMGGITNFISKDDIIVLKPNAQWWNQGMTNTDAMKAFIELIFAIPDFSGEIILAENHQAQDDNSRGWTTSLRNGEFNYNELIAFFRRQGFENITKYHWHNGGECPNPLQMDACCGKVVKGPTDGDGYVWDEKKCYVSPLGRSCPMSYPIFTSSYSGVTIDLKKGAWENNRYIDRSVKFINFSGLNHHGLYSGVTASIKNLMGVVDMTCGFPGLAPKGAYNVHHIGVSKKIKWLNVKVHWRLNKLRNKYRRAIEAYFARNFHHTGGALGFFMKNVRFPDLNIITAEYIGWGDRIKKEKAKHSQTILASRDPVALDYISAKKVLLPNTPQTEKNENGLYYYDLNNPNVRKGPFYKFLNATYEQGIGNLRDENIELIK